MSGKIVYGEYKIADVIGQIVGWSTEEDLKISETGEVEEKVLNGETVQEIHSNHGWQAQGTVVVTAPEGFVARKGTVLSVEKNGERKWFTVREWEESLDTDTGGVVASVTLEGRDSMQEEYQIGPRDPDTGEPLSGKVVLTVGIYCDTPLNWATWNGARCGLFDNADWDGNSEPDFSKAVAVSSLSGTQAVFSVAPADSLWFGAYKDGEILATQGAVLDVEASGVNSLSVEQIDVDASDSSSST